MAGQDPSPQTTLLILLGASDWPDARDAFLPAEAFAHAARAVKTYFLDGKGFGLPGENLLDRFDTDLSSDALDKEIGQFLEGRLAAMKRAGSAASDLLLYFIGHGDFGVDPEKRSSKTRKLLHLCLMSLLESKRAHIL